MALAKEKDNTDFKKTITNKAKFEKSIIAIKQITSTHVTPN